MLRVISTLGELPFAQLMRVYEKTNRDRGSLQWRQEPRDRQIALAEEDFYTYLRTCFFRTPGAVYYLWLEEGRAVSALRREPYRDGVLLAALETAPMDTGRGYATRLLAQTLDILRDEGVPKVYVHIHRRNAASQKVHLHCGFVKTARGAMLLDGSYNAAYDTYTYIF